MPNSRKVYVPGQLHPDLRVPFREISLAPTKTMSGEIEINEPVRVYDTSGPWGDADQQVDVNQGLPPLRRDWIRARNDVEEIPGRAVTPSTTDTCPKSTLLPQRRNVQRLTSNMQRPMAATGRHPLFSILHPRSDDSILHPRPRANLCAPAPAKPPSPNSPTLAAESSPPRWNTSRSASLETFEIRNSKFEIPSRISTPATPSAPQFPKR